jgi:hypothetical protein
MDRGRRILARHRPNSQFGSGFRGFNFQAGYGYVGENFQQGHGFKGEHFQRGHGTDVGAVRSTMCPPRMFRRHQRGQGWGWLSKFAARALPFLTRGVKEVGKQALTTVTDQAVNSSMRFLDDVLDGENVLDSARSRLKEGGDALRHTVKTKAKAGAMEVARTAKRKLAERAGVGQTGGGGTKRRRKCGTAKGRKKKKKVVRKKGRGKKKKGRRVSKSRASVRGGRKSKSTTFDSASAILPYRHIFSD